VRPISTTKFQKNWQKSRGKWRSFRPSGIRRQWRVIGCGSTSELVSAMGNAGFICTLRVVRLAA
jgi:hypothetical protein